MLAPGVVSTHRLPFHSVRCRWRFAIVSVVKRTDSLPVIVAAKEYVRGNGHGAACLKGFNLCK